MKKNGIDGTCSACRVGESFGEEIRVKETFWKP